MIFLTFAPWDINIQQKTNVMVQAIEVLPFMLKAYWKLFYGL